MPPRNSRFVTSLFLVVFALATLVLLRLFAVYTAAIILGAVLVSLTYPLFKRVLPRVRNRRAAAAAICTLGVVLIVLVPLALVLASLSAEAVAVYGRITAGEEGFLSTILGLLDSENFVVVKVRGLASDFGIDLSPESLRSQAATAGAAAAKLLYEQLRGAAQNVLRTLMHFGLMLVVMFALFAEGERLKAYLLDLSPLPDEQEEALVDRFAGISRAVFLGNGVASLLQGFLGGLGFAMFGVGSGVLWGSAIAFFAFLPIVGATVVFLPAAVYLWLSGEPGLALGFVLYNAFYVVVLEYGLKPRLIGGQSQMSGALVFVGILAGLNLFGILGLFYGPLILTMFLTLAEIYKVEYRDDLMATRSPWVSADRNTLSETETADGNGGGESEPEVVPVEARVET